MLISSTKKTPSHKCPDKSLTKYLGRMAWPVFAHKIIYHIFLSVFSIQKDGSGFSTFLFFFTNPHSCWVPTAIKLQFTYWILNFKYFIFLLYNFHLILLKIPIENQRSKIFPSLTYVLSTIYLYLTIFDFYFLNIVTFIVSLKVQV